MCCPLQRVAHVGQLYFAGTPLAPPTLLAKLLVVVRKVYRSFGALVGSRERAPLPGGRRDGGWRVDRV